MSDRAYVELVRAPEPLKPWWKDVAEVHLLFAWLVETTRINTLDEAVYFTEKPHKWGPERELMLREEEMERINEAELNLLAEQDQQRRAGL